MVNASISIFLARQERLLQNDNSNQTVIKCARHHSNRGQNFRALQKLGGPFVTPCCGVNSLVCQI